MTESNPRIRPTITSPFGRVKLVSPMAVDDKAMADLRSDARVRKYLRFLPERSTVEDVRNRRQTRSKNPQIFDMNLHVVNENGEFEFKGMTGCFNLDEANMTCEAGIILHPSLHGTDIATETFYALLKDMFDSKGFHRVTFETGCDNVSMRGWLESVAGARLEAQRKEAWKNNDGSYTDVAGYAILESEWRDRVKSRLERRLEQRGLKLAKTESAETSSNSNA